MRDSISYIDLRKQVNIIYQMIDSQTEQEAYDYFYNNLKEDNGEAEEVVIVAISQYALAFLFYKLQMYQEAIEYYNKALYTSRRDEFSRKGDPHFQAWLTVELAFVYCVSSNYDAAERLMRQVDQYEMADTEELVFHYTLLCCLLARRKNDYAGFCRNVARLAENDRYFIPLREFMELGTLIDYALFRQNLDLAEKLLELLKKAAAENHQGIKEAYLRTVIKYGQVSGNRDMWKNAITEYEKMSKKREIELLNAKRSNITNKDMIFHQVELKSRLERRVRDMKERAEIDALTKLPNRYRINEYGKEVFARVLESGKTLGVIMMDIDDFKLYNDMYGHLTGDKCLELLGSILKECAGRVFVARYGGDEFITIFEAADMLTIQEFSSELNRCIRKSTVTSMIDMTEIRFTISQGIVNSIPSKENSWSDFIHAADNALYKAKLAGKNQVYTAAITE